MVPGTRTSATARPRVSVVVSVRNASGLIVQQLDALGPQIVTMDAELIVVDDCSSDGTADEVDSWLRDASLPHAQLLRRDRRGGTNASRNDGLMAASSDVVAFCDGDDTVSENWLGNLVTAVAAGRIVGGELLENKPDGQVVTWPSDPVSHGWRYAYGGNLAARRADLIKIGGFDESIRAGGSEVEMAIRGQASGVLEVVSAPDARISYRRAQSPMGIFLTQFRKERGRSYLSIIHKSLGIEGRDLRSYLGLGVGIARGVMSSDPDSRRARRLARLLGRLIGWTWWLPCNRIGNLLHIREFRPQLLSTRHQWNTQPVTGSRTRATPRLRSAVKSLTQASLLRIVGVRLRTLRPRRLPGKATVWLAWRAWGNRRVSATPDFIHTANRVLLSEAPTHVLECGSGLTTIFAAFLGQKNGFDVYALENDERWRRRIQESVQLATLHLPDTSIIRYENFDWYDVAALELPSFQVVICDGPRGSTRGGRYGLAPVLGSRISGATVILDDSCREGERNALDRWTNEHSAMVSWNTDAERGMAIVRFPRGSPQ